MKYKYFAIIFIALAVTALSVSSIHYHFFKGERLRLIELNLEQNASLLMKSNLDLSKAEFTTKGNQFISDIIGDDKVNIIIGIFNLEGKVLYKNENAQIFNLPDVITGDINEWENIENADYFIKYLTVVDDEQARIIKVGMVLNQSLLRWKYLNQRIYIYVSIVLLVVSIFSFVLTRALFRPISLLTRDVHEMAAKIEAGELSEINTWFKSRRLVENNYLRDEFKSLVSSLDLLARRIGESQSLMQKWASHMAHELKTPMTRLKNSVERFTLKQDPKHLEEIESELITLEAIVMDFLAWASLEHDQLKPELHAVSLKSRLITNLNLCRKDHPDVDFDIKIIDPLDLRIFCNPLHFDQLITNIVQNAIKYSGKKYVQILVNHNSVEFRDYGAGIPQDVMDNIGKPFNKSYGIASEGHGLGLAWVKTICRRYDWNLEVKNDQGARVKVTFNEVYS